MICFQIKIYSILMSFTMMKIRGWVYFSFLLAPGIAHMLMHFQFCSAFAVRPSGDKPPSAFDPRFTDGNWDHFPRETSICALIQIFSENEKILHRPGPSCGQHLDYNTWWWWWHNVQKIKKRQVLNCELNKWSPKVK